MFLFRSNASRRNIRIIALWTLVCCWFLTYNVYFRETVELQVTEAVRPIPARSRNQPYENNKHNGVDAINFLQKSTSTCPNHHDCIACLYAHVNHSAPWHAMSSISGCVWCANQQRCVDSSTVGAAMCEDMEFYSCPAVLHTPIPQKHRVIHVGIRKGGPEALIQLHLALNHWGFRTTLDTRHSNKEKGGPVKSFFLEMCKEEFAKAPPLVWW